MSKYNLIVNEVTKELMDVTVFEDNKILISLSLKEATKILVRLLSNSTSVNDDNVQNNEFILSIPISSEVLKEIKSPSDVVPPKPLFGLIVPSVESFADKVTINDNDITFSDSELYYVNPPSECNGYLIEGLWLPKNYWGGCQQYQDHYRLKIPVFTQKMVPIIWRELRAIPLFDDSIFGIVLSHAKMPPDLQSPAFMIN